MAKKKIAVIGIGKISQDQHLPVIDKSKDFELAACVSTRASLEFSVTAAGVEAPAPGGFCEKPWAGPRNRPRPNPANTIPASSRIRAMAFHDTAVFAGRDERGGRS